MSFGPPGSGILKRALRRKDDDRPGFNKGVMAAIQAAYSCKDEAKRKESLAHIADVLRKTGCRTWHCLVWELMLWTMLRELSKTDFELIPE